MPSSPIAVPPVQLSSVAGMVQVLQLVHDRPCPPREPSRIAGGLAVALAAVLAGSRSFAAIGQWAGELTGAQLVQLGLSRPAAPHASIFRKVSGPPRRTRRMEGNCARLDLPQGR
jgi:hypothetical protein